MFSKAKTRPQPAPVPIPDLPDLPSPSARRQPAPEATAPAPSKPPSLIASGLKFEGNISGNGELNIEGAFKGDIRVGRLIVGETGAVEGGVSADYIEVRGRIVGAVSGKQVKLLGTAYVDGDITHEQLSIDVGAYFQGRCLQQRKDAPAPQQTPQPQAQAPAQQPAPQAVNFAAPRPPEAQLISMKPA